MSTQGVGEQGTGYAVVDFSGVTVKGIPTTITGVYDFTNSKYGGDVNSADNYAALNAACVDCANAGGGVVWLPAGTFKFSRLPTITSPYVRIKGAGLWVTKLLITTADGAGFAFSGTQAAPAKYCGLEDVFIECQTVATTATGLSLNYAQEFTLRNVQIADFITGIAQVHSPNSVFEYVECSYSGSGSGVGFAVDGSTPLGNVSSIWRDCSFAGTSASQATKGWYFYCTDVNGDLGDLNLFDCASAMAGFGFDFDFSKTNSTTSTDCSSDIILRDCVNDEFYQYGVRVLGANATTLVKIEGGYFNCNNGSATSIVGVYSTGTVLIEGAEFIPVQTPLQGANVAYAVQLVAGADGSVVSGCSINGWTRGVYVNGANAPVISGNRFFSTPLNGFGIAMVAATIYSSNSPTVTGNSFGASAAHGMSLGINLDVSITGTATVNGNTFAPLANIDQAINNGVTSPAIAWIEGNAGYNPLGGNVGQASFGASPATWTNNTGVFATVFITGGTISSIVVDGKTTGMVSGGFRVPPGKGITVTYTAAPTSVVTVGD